jgi:UDP-3-O-[3-hydroxymyristoyl] glucosamine N-acyltransferase
LNSRHHRNSTGVNSSGGGYNGLKVETAQDHHHQHRRLQRNHSLQHSHHHHNAGAYTVPTSDNSNADRGSPSLHAVSSNIIARKVAEAVYVTPPQDRILTHESARSSPSEVYCDSFY